jgi:hypothetical protein
MRMLCLALLTVALAWASFVPAPAQDKQEPGQEKAVKLDLADFPRVGVVLTKEELARKLQACKAKYEGKLVRVGGYLFKKADARQKVPVNTLRVTGFYLVEKRPIATHVDIDFVTARPAPELNQPSRSGLIVDVVGRATFTPSGRLLLKGTRVLSASIPPG